MRNIWAGKMSNFFLKNGPIPASFFRLFYKTQFNNKLIKALMVFLGLEPGEAGWKVQTNPLSYDGSQKCLTYKNLKINYLK